MNPENNTNSLKENDPLWKIAKQRVEFRQSMYIYLVVNAFLWIIWFFTASSSELEFSTVPWPIYPLFGWGLGMAIAYVNLPSPAKPDPIEKEYEAIKSREKN